MQSLIPINFETSYTVYKFVWINFTSPRIVIFYKIFSTASIGNYLSVTIVKFYNYLFRDLDIITLVTPIPHPNSPPNKYFLSKSKFN